jgi:hypothetical protein
MVGESKRSNDTGVLDCAFHWSGCAFRIANRLLQLINGEGTLVDCKDLHSGNEPRSLCGASEMNVRNRSIGANLHANGIAKIFVASQCGPVARSIPVNDAIAAVLNTP